MQSPQFRTFFASSDDDVLACQRLRHEIFVSEMGARETTSAYEVDRFDQYADHLMLVDDTRPVDDRLVGVYRLMDSDQANAAGGFSCESEYDLSPLHNASSTLLELGRSCVHPNYRSGMALYHLWQALAAHVRDTETQILFGAASFPGTDPSRFSHALTHLHDAHLAPSHLKVASKAPAVFPRPTNVDRKVAMAQMPPLIKAYLRLGGKIGSGAFVDHAFNTTDVCMIVDVESINENQKNLCVLDRR